MEKLLNKFQPLRAFPTDIVRIQFLIEVGVFLGEKESLYPQLFQGFVFTVLECLRALEKRDEADLETVPGSANCLTNSGSGLSFAVAGINLNQAFLFSALRLFKYLGVNEMGKPL